MGRPPLPPPPFFLDLMYVLRMRKKRRISADSTTLSLGTAEDIVPRGSDAKGKDVGEIICSSCARPSILHFSRAEKYRVRRTERHDQFFGEEKSFAFSFEQILANDEYGVMTIQFFVRFKLAGQNFTGETHRLLSSVS